MKKSLHIIPVLCLSTMTALSQSWVTTPGSSLPNDTVASTYYPYHATKTSSIKYGSSSSEVGDIYVPDYTGNPVPANSTHRPAIVVVHGGGGTSGTRTETRSTQTSQLFAAHGYVAFNIDYALGAVYPQNIYDWRLAVRYLRANATKYGIDPNHIGLTGGSFGGYAAALMSGITDGQKTGADSNSRYNFISLDTDGQGHPELYSGDVQAVMDFYGPTTISTANGNALGQFSSPTSATYKWASPTTYVSANSKPTMICFGTADSTVSPSNDTTFQNDLVAAGAPGKTTGIPLSYASIPGGQHTFCIWDSTKGGTWPTSGPLSHSGTIDLRQDAAVFFDTYLLTTSNSPPLAVNDSATTSLNTAVTINVLANDSDPNGNTITITAHGSAAHGTVTNTSTTVTYTPVTGYTGSDSFTYTISDGSLTATATVSMTVNSNVNVPPVAATDTATTTAGVAVNINVLANDTDANNDTLTITGVGSPTAPAHGNVAFTSTIVTYTPTAGYTGPDSFSYAISDGHGGTATGTVNVTVSTSTGTSTQTVTVSATATVDSGTPTTDVDEATLGYVSTKFSSALTASRKAYFQFDVSSLSVAANGTATFTVNFTNTYQMDVQLWALNQSYAGFSSVLTWSTAQANDTGSNSMLTSGAFTATPIGAPALIPTSSTNPYTFSIPNIGTYVQGGKVTLVLTGVDNTSNNASGARYNRTSATLVMPVLTANLPPVAVDDTASTPINAPVTLHVLANDSDPNNDPISIQSVTAPANGNVTNTSTTVTYTPNTGFAGNDSFTYTITDGSLTATANVKVTVTAATTSTVAISNLATIDAGIAAPSTPSTSGSGDFDESTYVTVKFKDTLTSARKAYFQFDVSSLVVQAAGTATFTVNFTNTYQQDVQLWALNQSYPSFDNHITWNTAQANSLGDNSMNVTATQANPFTATAIGSPVVIPTSGTNPYTFSIPNIGTYVQGGKVTLVLTGVDNTSNNASGLRMGVGGATATAAPALVVPLNSNPPNISSISDQNVNANTPISIPFTVGDAETPASALTVTGSASDATLVQNVTISGTGADRMVTVTPVANKAGGTPITLTVNDGSLTTSEAFFLTVGSPVQQWWFQYFGSTDYSASAGSAAYNANPSGDGISNLQKYAEGGNPFANDSSTGSTVTQVGATVFLSNPLFVGLRSVAYYDPVGGYVYLLYHKAAGDLIYDVQENTDLTNPNGWTTVGGSDIPGSEFDINDVTYSVGVPWDGITPIFLRLNISTQ